MSRRKIIFLFIPIFLLSTPLEGAVNEDAIRYRIRGYQLQHQGYVEEAIELYRKAIEADPNYAAPHNDLGVIYEERGDLKLAEGEYLETLRIDPQYVDAYSNLAILYGKQNQREKMLEMLKKRVDLGEPEDIGTREAQAKLDSLGVVTEIPEKPRPAVPPFEKRPSAEIRPLKEIPEAPPVVEAKEEQKALREEMKAVKKEILEKETAARKLEDREKAVQVVEEPAAEKAAALRNEGLKHHQKGELDEAIRNYREAIRMNPDFATAYNDLGIALEEKGFLENAETQYLNALALDPSYTHALYNLALLYAKMERRKEAIQTLEEFLKKKVDSKRSGVARAKLEVLLNEEKEEAERLAREQEAKRLEAEAKRRQEEEARKREEALASLRGEVEKEVKAEYEEKFKLTQFFEQGKVAFQNGDYPTAKDLFEKLLVIDPENEMGKTYLAKVEETVQEAERKKEIEAERQRQEAEEARRMEEEKRVKEEEKQKRTTALYDEAKEMYRSGNLDNALLRFQEILILEPEHPYAGRYVDRIRERKEELEAERIAREKAAREEDQARRRQIAEYFEEAEKQVRERSYDEAIKTYRELLLLDPEHKEANRRLEEIRETLRKKKEEKHLAKIRKKETRLEGAEKRMKESAQTYYQAGLKAFREEKLDQAEYAFRKVLSYDKSHKEANKQLVLLMEKQAELEARVWREEQEAIFRKEYTPAEEKRLYERAKAAYDAGDYRMAQKTLEYLLFLDPNHPFAPRDLDEVEAKIRVAHQKEAVAEAALKKEARKTLSRPPSVSVTEPFLRAQTKPQEIPYFRPSPSDRLDAFVEDEPVWTDAHQAMERVALAYHQQAYDLQRQNDVEGAIAQYRKAMAIRSTPGAANSLGVLYEKKGWYTQAEQYYKKALRLDPAYLAAHTNLALLYEDLERKEEALAHWRIRAEQGKKGEAWTEHARRRLEAVQAVPEKNP